MNDEKKFVTPTADVVYFESDDIITRSLTDGGSDPGFLGEEW